MTLIHFLAVWRGGRFRRLAQSPLSYVVGLTILGVSHNCLLWFWGSKWEIKAFIAMTVSVGLPVIVGHHLKADEVLKDELKTLKDNVRDSADA